MSDPNETPPLPLDYASPSKHRSFQEAFTEYVADEIDSGRLKPPTQTKRRIAWLVIWSGLIGTVIAIWMRVGRIEGVHKTRISSVAAVEANRMCLRFSWAENSSVETRVLNFFYGKCRTFS